MIYEVWRPLPIKRFAQIYEVSDYGRVRSIDRVKRRQRTYHGRREEPRHAMRIKGRLLQPYLMKIGYYRVTLGVGSEHHYVHKLVAKAFVPNPLKLREVNHKDCDQTNNHWSNLEWVTHGQNMEHAMANGRLGRAASGRWLSVLGNREA